MPLIQCLTPFPGGTKLPQGDRVYHFVRNNRGAYVADVLERDVDAVLSIGAGYIKYDSRDPVESVDPAAHKVKPRTRTKASGETFEESTTAFLTPATREPDAPLHRPTRPTDPRTPAAKEPKAKVKTHAKTAKKGAKVVKTPAAKGE